MPLEERHQREELGPAAPPQFDEPPEKEKLPTFPRDADRGQFDPHIDYIYENDAYRPVRPMNSAGWIIWWARVGKVWRGRPGPPIGWRN